MSSTQPPSTFLQTRKSARIALAPEFSVEARSTGVNLIHADAVAGHGKEHWLKENFEAPERSNAFVEKHGLPLERQRVF